METAILAGKAFDEGSVNGKKAAEKRGNEIITLSEDEAARWREKTRPVVDDWLKAKAGAGHRRRRPAGEGAGTDRQVPAGLSRWRFARRLSDRLGAGRRGAAAGLAVLVTASVLTRWLTAQGVPGDFELLQIGLALAVFAFMPLCQLRGGNLFVDTFTDAAAVQPAARARRSLVAGLRGGRRPDRGDDGGGCGRDTAPAARAAWCWAARSAGRSISRPFLPPGSTCVVLLTALRSDAGARQLSDAALGALSFVILLVLMALRMPIGLAMFVVGAVGYVMLNDVATLLAWLKSTPYYLFSNYTLSVIPLFILMGALAGQAGLSQTLFRAADAVIGSRPRRHRHGSDRSLHGIRRNLRLVGRDHCDHGPGGAAGAAPLRLRGGTGDRYACDRRDARHPHPALDHPDHLRALDRAEHQQAVHGSPHPRPDGGCVLPPRDRLLVRRNPAAGPPGPKLTAAERRAALVDVWPVLLIAIVVVGGIYGGIFTPTEGAAVGVIAMLILGAVMRTLGPAEIADSLRQTAETTAMIFIVLLGAEMFNAFLAISELPIEASEMIVGAGLPPTACSWVCSYSTSCWAA